MDQNPEQNLDQNMNQNMEQKPDHNLGQNPDQVTALGNFGITGTVGQFQYLRQNSEFFGIVINNTGTVYKLKFPNYCPASRQYKV
ncbi:MAG: hypothetical protein ACK56I_25290, partial [bacterium]